MMKLVHSKFGIYVAILMSLTLVACENPTANTEDDESNEGPNGDQTTLITPPETLVGTVALNNGTSAVVELTFTEDDAAAQVTASATYNAGGLVRYESITFSATGSYDSATGEASITATADGGSSIAITGTWDPDTGFSGTASLRNPEGVEIAAGSINGAGVGTGSESSIPVFIGTYGGTVYGSWNGVISDGRFYGTYAASDGSNDQGSFSATYDSTTDAIASGAAGPDDIPFGGNVSSDEASISGWYAGIATDDVGGDVSISGTWSGVKVDDNYDTPDFGVSSDGELVANRLFQAIGSAVRVALDTLEDDPEGTGENVAYSEGFDPTITIDTGTTVLLDAQFDGDPSPETFQGYTSLTIEIGSAGYTDPVSGLTLGEGTITASFEVNTAPDIRSFSGFSVDNNTNDIPYIVITFPDDSTGNLAIGDGTIDATNETVGGETWQFPDAGVGDPPNDVRDIVEAALF